MYLGENIPKLGFGLMRLPMIGEDVDIEQTKDMVDLFLSKGFTYFDTAYGYLGGKSEMAIKTALVDRYPRESFQLATKLPAWAGAKNAEEAQQMFYTSLERTGAGYFDFYLLHNLGGNRIQVFEDYDIWNFVAERKKEGLIKHIGFSLHDTADNLEKILIAHPEVEFVQLQLNYIDWESNSVQSRKCYEMARKYNKPVVVMEPIKGGTLSVLPDDIAANFKDYAPDASLSSWALRYVASLDGLVTVLSGMSTLEQMKDNVSFMSDFKPLTDQERAVIAKVVDDLNKRPTIPCTGCGYCTKGCPQNIPIPEIFRAMNMKYTFDNDEAARTEHFWGTNRGIGPSSSACIACGQCESVCPQEIDIIEKLKICADFFGK